MKKLSSQTIILFFIMGLILLVLIYFIFLRNNRDKNQPEQNQIKSLAPPTTTFKGPDSQPHAKGPTGPPPGY